MAALTALFKSGHCLEMLSLLAIHFHTNQRAAAIQLIRDTLGSTVSIHGDSFNQVSLYACTVMF